MTPVEERLRRRILLTGPITVAEYMAACMTDPDGYYARREPFGVTGDFVTAPEITPMFGELVGAWLVNAWMADGRPTPFDLVELGPGRGTLMADILKVARAQPDFFAASRVVLVEASDRLKKVQRERLTPLHPAVRWASGPVGERAIYCVANEFFDALPVRQFVRRGSVWHERTVGLGACGQLVFGLSPFGAPLEQADDAADGTVREVRPRADALMEEIAGAIAAHAKGAALVIDYGYDGLPQDGSAETLQAVRNHQPVDVLADPGFADLSAHVDFAALESAARRSGAAVHGPVGQGTFLLALGLLERAGQLGAGSDAATQEAIHAAVQRIAGEAEGEMGALFKVLAVTARAENVPGFAVEATRERC